MLVAVAVSVLVTVAVAVDAGGGVIVRVTDPDTDDDVVRLCFLSGSSQQPKKRPGVSQVSESDVVLVGVVWVEILVVVSHPPPNQPGLQVVEAEVVVDAGTDVDVLDVVGTSVVVVTVRFADTWQPNQPGVKQVVVVYVVVATG